LSDDGLNQTDLAVLERYATRVRCWPLARPD
jgi:hypothetical protein